MEAGERDVGVDERPQAADASELLRVRGVFKNFGGTEALADVGMILRAGEILALLGENGAGKSTLIKILAGVYTLDAGQVSFRGADVTHALRRLPIAFIHQDLGLIDWMTVAENICMTLGFPRRLGMIDRDAARHRAAIELDALSAAIDPDTRVQNLSRTEKSLVAIAAHSPSSPRSMSSTSRPQVCRLTRWCGCSRPCAGCAHVASR
jgi:ribose transport system ATP-binding protein